MLGFLFSRFGLAAMALVALLIGHQVYKVHYKNVGKQEVIQESTKELEKLGAKSKEARKRVDTDDKYFDRRLRQYCRDCKQGKVVPRSLEKYLVE